MGGHGGLNILPQKKWNVYNYDNRAIVEKDKKQAAAKRQAEKEQKRDEELENKMSVLMGEEGKKEKRHSLISEELRRMNEGERHVNLFEKEEELMRNRDQLEEKRIREEEFLKDKNMDESTRFLGQYRKDERRPWYAKKKGESRYERSSQKRQTKRSRSRSRSRQKHTKEKGKSEMDLLREKRLKREKKEKLKAELLKKSKY